MNRKSTKAANETDPSLSESIAPEDWATWPSQQLAAMARFNQALFDDAVAMSNEAWNHWFEWARDWTIPDGNAQRR